MATWSRRSKAEIPQAEQAGGAGSFVLRAVAVLSLSLVVFPVTVQALLFLLNVPLSLPGLLVGFALGLAFPLVLLERRRELLIAYGIVAIAVLLALTVQGRSWDNAHDSLVYHEPAAVAIAGGMNPVYDSTGNMWIDHYPKAAWVFSAGVYRLSGNIEYGKVLTVLIALACFGVAATFFRGLPRLPRWLAYPAATLVTLSPVTLVQLDTHYVDGLFANLAIILILLAISHRAWGGLPGSTRLIDGAIAVSAATILANLKFTGLVFVVGLGVMHCLFTYVLAPRRSWGRGATLLLTAAVVGILLVGFDPYVTNTVQDGNPFCPVFGTDLTNVEDAPDTGQRPVAYRDVLAPVAFLMSLTDTTRAGSQDDMPDTYRPKNPLSITRSEMLAMTYPDARTAGFGPLFLLALLLALAALGVGLLGWGSSESGDGSGKGILWYGLVLVVVLTLGMGEAWWARLAPAFYLAVPLIALTLLTRPDRSRVITVAAYAVLGVLVANSLLVAAAQAFDYRNRQVTRSQTLSLLADARQVDMRCVDSWVESQQSGSLLLRLRHAGVTPTLIPCGEGGDEGWQDVPALLGAVRIRR